MHGQYIRSADKQLIGEGTFQWLLRGDMIRETSSEIIETQDQALQTKYHATKILLSVKNNKCGLRQKFYETVHQIISACRMINLFIIKLTQCENIIYVMLRSVNLSSTLTNKRNRVVKGFVDDLIKKYERRNLCVRM